MHVWPSPSFALAEQSQETVYGLDKLAAASRYVMQEHGLVRFKGTEYGTDYGGGPDWQPA